MGQGWPRAGHSVGSTLEVGEVQSRREGKVEEPLGWVGVWVGGSSVWGNGGEAPKGLTCSPAETPVDLQELWITLENFEGKAS